MLLGCSPDNSKISIPEPNQVVSNIEFQGMSANEFTKELTSHISNTKGLTYKCWNGENRVDDSDKWLEKHGFTNGSGLYGRDEIVGTGHGTTQLEGIFKSLASNAELLQTTISTKNKVIEATATGNIKGIKVLSESISTKNTSRETIEITLPNSLSAKYWHNYEIDDELEGPARRIRKLKALGQTKKENERIKLLDKFNQLENKLVYQLDGKNIEKQQWLCVVAVKQ